MSTDTMENELPAEGKRRRHYMRWLALCLLLVCGVAWYGVSQRSTSSSLSRFADDRYSVMDVRLQNLENSVSLYAERITKLEKQAEELAHLQAQAASSQQPVSTTAAAGESEAKPPHTVTAEDAKRIETLEKELAAMKTAAPLQDGEHIAHSIKLLSSFHRLSDRALSGKPYADQLSEFEDTFAGNQAKALSQLAPYADNGIPTLAELLGSFDTASDQLSAAQSVPPADASLWERFVFNITHLVRIQRIDQNQTGKDVDSIVGRASAHLDKGEIEAAFAEINTLPDSARSHFSNWLEEAQIAIDAPGIIDQLEEQVMQQVFHPANESAPSSTSDKGLNIQ